MPCTRIVDAAYGAMIDSIRSDANPNLVYMHYDREAGVKNLILIPRFFFAETSIEMRKPLSESARSAGWIGCNIRLDRIAQEGRIQLVLQGSVLPRHQVRQDYARLAPLRTLSAGLRGWSLNVLELISGLGSKEFSLADAYSMESVLSARFPNNRNVRPKIRQPLQVLRDLGLVSFLGAGNYRLNT